MTMTTTRLLIVLVNVMHWMAYGKADDPRQIPSISAERQPGVESSTFLFDKELNDFSYDFYNFYRRAVYHGLIQGQPKAKYMPYVVWDEQLALWAANQSSLCWQAISETLWQMDANSQIYGRSVYVLESPYNITSAEYLKSVVNEAFKSWQDQSTNFIYPNQCQPGSSCNDYTQMVSAKTQRFGCGLSLCFVNSNQSSSSSESTSSPISSESTSSPISSESTSSPMSSESTSSPMSSESTSSPMSSESTSSPMSSESTSSPMSSESTSSPMSSESTSSPISSESTSSPMSSESTSSPISSESTSSPMSSESTSSPISSESTSSGFASEIIGSSHTTLSSLENFTIFNNATVLSGLSTPVAQPEGYAYVLVCLFYPKGETTPYEIIH